MKPRPFLLSLLAGAVAAAVVLLVLAAWLHWRPEREPPLEARPPLDAPYVQTIEEAVDAMLDLAAVGPGDQVVDLGCGDGRILIAAARRGARGYGVDIDPARIAEAEANARRGGVAGRLRFEVRDLFETELGGADVVALYLLPEVNLQLRPRLLSELRPGARIVSNSFDMGDWRPDRTATVGGAPLYLWIVPSRVGGRWTLTDEDGRSGTVALRQRYQAVTGNVRNARLAGDRLRFAANLGGVDRAFEGRVAGARIEPLDPADSWRMERVR